MAMRLRRPEFTSLKRPSTSESLEDRVSQLERGKKRMERGYFILLAVAILATYLAFHAQDKLSGDEHHTRKDAAQTRKIQRQGEPVAVCLLDSLRAVEPLLLHFPSAQDPLHSYIILQSNRYTSVTCPSPKRAEAIVKAESRK